MSKDDKPKANPKAKKPKTDVMISFRAHPQVRQFLLRMPGGVWVHGAFRRNLMRVLDDIDLVMAVDPVGARSLDKAYQVGTSVNLPIWVVERMKSIAASKLVDGKPISLNELLNQACKDASAKDQASAEAPASTDSATALA